MPGGLFQPIRFGKYLLIDKIARGGMAEIFLAKLYEKSKDRLALSSIARAASSP